MALNLRDTLKKSHGGSIGVTIDGKKVWFDEDKFMKLLADSDTKKKMLKYIAPGRQKLDDEGVLMAKSDLSKAPDRSETTPPESAESGKWDETEPPEVFNKNMAKKPQLSEQDRLVPEETAEVIPQTKDEKATAKIMSQAGEDPYAKKDEYEAITPENYPQAVEQWREAFNREAKRFDFLKQVNPMESARRKIENGAEERFNERFGNRGMEYYLLKDYRKDPNLKEDMYEYDQWERGNKEEIIRIERGKYAKAEREYKNLLFYYKRFTEEQRDRQNEIIRQRKEEAEKVTDDEKIKNMENLAKTLKSLREAQDSGDEDAMKVLEAKVNLLKKMPGNEAEVAEGEPLETEETVAATGKYGIKNEGQMVEHLKSLGYSDKKIDATLKEFARRKK